MRHIVIVGSSKTGTTGLFYSVRSGLERSGEPFYSLYEKHSARIYRYLDLYAPNRLVVAKLLVTNKTFDWRVAAEFRSRLLIVRDPRDTLVSALLFFPVLAVNQGVSSRKIEQFTEIIRRKEADPKSVSMRELLERAYTLNATEVNEDTAYSSRFRKTMAYNDRVESFVVRYEAFVDGNLADLEDHLGFKLGSGKSASSYSHIERTSSYGGWRNWFVDSDIDYFRSLLNDYMTRYGYEDDWELSPDPTIRTEEASGYIERSCRTRKEQRAIYGNREETSEERVELLRGRADAGDSDASLQLGEMLLEQAGDPAAAEGAARLDFAACTGSVKAMQLLSKCYREGLGVAPDVARAAFWQREARQLRKAQELRKEVEELRAREKELAAAQKQLRSELDKAKQLAKQRAKPTPSFASRLARRAKRDLRRVRSRIRAGRT